MSLITMTYELTGIVPKLPPDYAKTIINRAWMEVRRKSLWSFQLFDQNWTSPAVVNAGTVTVTQGSNQVVFDATAAAAIAAIGLTPSSVTQRQFRVGIGTIYNIWAYDAGTLTATLDRNYQEATGAGVAYDIYQCYYVVPYRDFLTFLSVRDIINFNHLILNKTRAWVDQRDPQRTIVYIPTHVVPYQRDNNPASATYGYPMYELWAQPNYVITWQLWGIRRGADLSAPTDVLPPAIGEDVVMAKARALAYEWAMANSGDNPRDQGPNFAFLIGKAEKDFSDLWKESRRQDRETCDNWYSVRRGAWSFPNDYGFYSSTAGFASPGAPWGI